MSEQAAAAPGFRVPERYFYAKPFNKRDPKHQAGVLAGYNISQTATGPYSSRDRRFTA